MVELVSAADLKALEARVGACEKGLAAQDAKIGALRDKPAPPNPPAAAARPPAAARRQLSSATGDETEFAITERKATLSFNSRTPNVTPTRLTGEGDGKLTCSGELHATDFVTAEGGSLVEQFESLRKFVGMVPPSTPPTSPPVPPPTPPPTTPPPPSAPPPPSPPSPPAPPPSPLAAVSASMSSVYEDNPAWGASNCIDGVTSIVSPEEGPYCHSAAPGQTNPWLSLEFANDVTTESMIVYNRGMKIPWNGCCQSRLGVFEVWVGPAAGDFTSPSAVMCASMTAPGEGDYLDIVLACHATGRFVTILLPGSNRMINLREVQVYGTTSM